MATRCVVSLNRMLMAVMLLLAGYFVGIYTIHQKSGQLVSSPPEPGDLQKNSKLYALDGSTSAEPSVARAAKCLLHGDSVQPRSQVSVLAVGDVSFGRDISDFADANYNGSVTYVFDHVRDYFLKADISILNLETTIKPGDRAIVIPKTRGIMMEGHRDTVAALKSIDATVVSIAHNHLLDMGPRPVLEMTTMLRNAGIMSTGISNKSHGESVAMFVRHNMTFAVMSFCDLDECSGAKSQFGVGAQPFVKTDIKKLVLAIRNTVDIIIVTVHWGKEYYFNVDSERKSHARFLASLGVDIVLGHHPHVLQDHEIIRGTFITYSLGNFIFDSHVCRNGAGEMLSEENISQSKACADMHNRRRSGVAEAVRDTRIYSIRVSKRGFESAKFLPCRIGTELHYTGKPIYRPVPETKPGVWVDVCSAWDLYCTGCSPAL